MPAPTRFAAGYCDHGNAARAAREAGLGEGSGARRKGYQLLQKPHVRAAIAARSAAVLNHAHQRAEDDARAAALTRDAELDRLARLELTALLKIEEAERRQRILMRLHHEVMAGGRHRVGSQGGAQSRFSRVCRQYFGEPAHREPGRCCCGSLATSPRGASCDRCRERNRQPLPRLPQDAPDLRMRILTARVTERPPKVWGHAISVSDLTWPRAKRIIFLSHPLPAIGAIHIAVPCFHHYIFHFISICCV